MIECLEGREQSGVWDGWWEFKVALYSVMSGKPNSSQLIFQLHLGAAVEAANACAVDIARDEADARLAGLGHGLQPLHKESALSQMRIRIPVVHYVVQQIRMVEPGQQTSHCC